MDDVLFQPATRVADLLRRRKVSARELTHVLLERIDRVNPVVNAVIELRREAALAEAAAVDAAGSFESPLSGVPITIKDCFDVAGMHTTWGNPAFKDFVATSDAVVVQRLKQAGAIIVGKTNVAFMLGDFAQTANPLYGVTNNPWDASLVPGGSSGGAAAALAAGMSFLEYGTDVVGSIRIPASFCGVYGLKPSARIVPLTGMQPAFAPPTRSDMRYMSNVGPLARSAADVRLALELTGGPEVPDAAAFTWRLPPPRRTRLADVRVGVVVDDPHCPVSSEVGCVLSNAVDALARAGATIVEGWPGGVDPAADAESFAFEVQAFFVFQDPPAEGGPSLADFARHEQRRMQSRAAWMRYFEEVDVFLCPTNFTPPFPHDARPFEERTITTAEGDRRYDAQPFWIAPASFSGMPALSAPVGRTESGRPIGAQIVGPLFEDDTPITFAELLADVVGGYEIPPTRVPAR